MAGRGTIFAHRLGLRTILGDQYSLGGSDLLRRLTGRFTQNRCQAACKIDFSGIIC
jgi:hypothetical protein